MKKILFSFISFVYLSSLSLLAQHHVSVVGLETFNPKDEADNTVKRIVESVGLKKNFVIEQGYVSNAKAEMKGSKRYITYNLVWIQELAKNNDWAAIFVLAHEVGHHLNNHPLELGVSTPPTELEADYFAGFALFKLGASLPQTLEALEGEPLQASETHPGRAERISAATEGFNYAKTSEKGLDSDGDGIFDREDECPSIAGSLAYKGCPLITEEQKITYVKFYSYAQKEYQNTHYQQALALFQKAIEVMDTASSCYYYKGMCAFYLGNEAEALTYLDKAITLNPKYVQSYQAAAFICVNTKLKRYEQAIVHYLEKGLAYAPNNADLWAYKGVAYYHLLQMKPAKEAIQKAYALAPKDDYIKKWYKTITK